MIILNKTSFFVTTSKAKQGNKITQKTDRKVPLQHFQLNHPPSLRISISAHLTTQHPCNNNKGGIFFLFIIHLLLMSLWQTHCGSAVKLSKLRLPSILNLLLKIYILSITVPFSVLQSLFTNFSTLYLLPRQSFMLPNCVCFPLNATLKLAFICI